MGYTRIILLKHLGYNVIFQFPLWDTQKLLVGLSAFLHFQFPLWDTLNQLMTLLNSEFSFNSLYGIQQIKDERNRETEFMLSIPFMGYQTTYENFQNRYYFQFPLWDTK